MSSKLMLGARLALLYAVAVALPSLVAAQDREAPPIDAPLAQLRGPTLPVPSDGALVFVSSDGSSPMLEVRGPDGALLEGSLLPISEDIPMLYAWVPAMALPLGTLAVTILHPFDSSSSTSASVEVVPPFAPGLPALSTEPSASWQTATDSTDCCATPFGEQLESTCFVTRYSSTIRVQPGFSSPEPQSVLNQYLFRVVAVSAPDIHSSSSSFRPLEHPLHEALFYEVADEYCFEIHAQHIATSREEVYSSGPSCVTHGERALGAYLRAEIDPRSLSVFGCPKPPIGFEEAWCELNEGACGIDDDDACELYAYNCKNGPLPQAWQERAAAHDHDVVPRRTEDEGCTVTRVHRGLGAGSAFGILCVLALGRRRFGRR